MILLLLATALAAPDRAPARYTIGSEGRDLAITPDGAWLAATAGADAVQLLDLQTWTLSTFAACAGANARGLATRTTSSGVAVHVGCADGTVATLTYADGVWALEADAVTVGTGEVLGVETDGTNVYAVVTREEGNPEVYAYLAADGATISGWPVVLGSAVVRDTAFVDGYLLVAHGNDDVSKVLVSAATATLPVESLGRSYVDLWAASSTAVFVADSGGGIVEYNIGSNDFDIDLDLDATLGAFGGEVTEAWCVVGTSTSLEVYAYADGPAEALSTIDGVADPVEIIGAGAYAYVTTAGGELVVATDAPWVEIASSPSGDVVPGEAASLTFTSDTEGTWEVRLDGPSGDLLDDGSIGAGDEATVALDTSTFAEGANRVWVGVTAGGVVGHDAVDITVDGPPSTVALSAGDLDFGDGQLTLRFDGVADADLDHYVVYVTTTQFAGADYPTGGPVFDGTDTFAAPFDVPAEPSAGISQTLSPLTNGTTYYVAVRAVDTGGQEGPMSEVISGAPQTTVGAAELANEPGGWCGASLPASVGGVMLAAAFAAARRRRAAISVGGALALVALLAPARAEAAPYVVSQTVGLRYGPVTLADPVLGAFYGDEATEMLEFEYGITSKFFDVTLGVGLFQELGFRRGVLDGAASGEHEMFTMYPINVNVTGRLELMKGDVQPIVPFGRIGVDMTPWRSNWYVDASDERAAISGGDLGWHWAAGAALRLDALDPTAASELEARTGIVDTWLVWEWRDTTMTATGSPGFDLSTAGWTLGLKLDF